MPIYEYQCTRCGHELEALQKLSDKPLRECPECGRHSLTRLVSAPMFRLGGSGWYETDFKSDKETKRNLLEKGGKEPAASEQGEGKAGGKTEAAKPAVKAESKPEGGKRVMVSKPSAAAKSGRPAKKAAKPARKGPARGRTKR